MDIDNNPVTFEEAIDAIYAELRKLLVHKHEDYGPDNILHFGEYGVVMRAQDKISRLATLVPPKGYTKPGPAVADEKICDTWADLANYAIIALLLRKDLFALPLVSTTSVPEV